MEKMKYGKCVRVCNFKIGEGIKECKYWMNEKKKKCGMCRGIGRGKGYRGTDEIFDERGERWMTELERKILFNKYIINFRAR